ncbi:MAG TPA: thiol-disulfide isomerase [Bryobacteraceae bacterium]|nr:thiol-disulfide isomerase [Bryobacteraceae bacterium]
MAFTNYSDTRPWAKAIKEAVAGRTMPPWHADKRSQVAFQNDRSLSPMEIRKIVAWVDGGAVEGPKIDYPKPVREESGWKLGRPDVVLRIPGFKIPARGDIPYTFVIRSVGLTNDRWVRGAEFKIDKRSVVHHMNAFVRPPGSSYLESFERDRFVVPTLTQRRVGRPDEGVFARRELLLGYEPGYLPIPWGEDQAKLIRAGSDIVFEIHYTANGTEQTDFSEFGLYFADKEPRERVLSTQTQDMGIAIPAGDANYQSSASITFGKPVKLISLQPHMHLRGKAMEIRARYPSGEVETLLNVPRYSFNWQTTYFLKEPKLLPAGSTIESTATFDNSPNNPHNPDPKKTIQWGDQSWEEMHIGFMEIAFDATVDAETVIDASAKEREKKRFERSAGTER